MLGDFFYIFARILGVMGARHARSNPYCPPWYMDSEIVCDPPPIMPGDRSEHACTHLTATRGNAQSMHRGPGNPNHLPHKGLWEAQNAPPHIPAPAAVPTARLMLKRLRTRKR